uniref:Secreted protein n=1 Tax=Globodera pallida TaxID=36090 RepID=A0A183BKX8_GLOPA
MPIQSLIVHLCVIVVLAHLCFASTKCMHTFRYRGGNDKTPKDVQSYLKKWGDAEKLMKGGNDTIECKEDNLKCLIMTCEDADKKDLIRITGCQVNDTTQNNCATHLANVCKSQILGCIPCNENGCNNAPELDTVPRPLPPTTTTTTTTAPPPTVEASTAGAGVVTLTATTNAIIMLMLLSFGALLFH